jgi:hypothetical protein
MLIFSEISFQLNSYDDGFGFSCLKAAYHFNIKGRMDYSSNAGAIIKAEGDSRNIREFLHWMEGNVMEIHGLQYSNSTLDTTRFKEFDLFRHSG